ncbi:MAG: hypothetical protein IOC71_03065, partial [Rhodobacter sp.]|nr:hypothetical protein [Rhodobacter sp.]
AAIMAKGCAAREQGQKYLQQSRVDPGTCPVAAGPGIAARRIGPGTVPVTAATARRA